MAVEIDSKLIIANQQSTTPSRVNTFAAVRNDGTPVKRDNFLYVGDYTSKNRLKISDYETLFFNTFQYGIETDVWDTETTGTASAAWVADTNQILLSIGGTAGDKVIRQTKNVQKYVPGRSSTISFAVTLRAPVEGIRKRFGMFDIDFTGFWFEDSGVWVDGIPQYNCVVSNGGTPTIVSRSNWNGDKLDGTGISGIVADATKIQLINVCYEWYGAGEVRFGFVIDGYEHIVHTHRNGNRHTLPWAQTPFLPIRMELEALSTVLGGPFTLVQGSNSLISEGSISSKGVAQNITSPITGTTMTAANTWYPALSLRLRSSVLKGVALLDNFQVATIDNTNIFYRLVRNANLAVTGANGWVNMPDSNSFTQYQTYTAPGEVILANQGIGIYSGFVVNGGGGAGINLSKDSIYQIGRTQLGTVSDTYTLLCASNNANKAALASLTWIEQR
jgi:hypothetical protein